MELLCKTSSLSHKTRYLRIFATDEADGCWDNHNYTCGPAPTTAPTLTSAPTTEAMKGWADPEYLSCVETINDGSASSTRVEGTPRQVASSNCNPPRYNCGMHGPWGYDPDSNSKTFTGLGSHDEVTICADIKGR